MKYPFQLEEYPGSQFEIESNFRSGKIFMYKDGEKLLRVRDLEGQPFSVIGPTGELTHIYAKNAFPDPAPKITVNNTRIHYVQPVKWYEYVVAAFPIILALFLGAYFGVLAGIPICILNFQILRSSFPTPVRYLAVTLVSGLLFYLILYIASS